MPDITLFVRTPDGRRHKLTGKRAPTDDELTTMFGEGTRREVTPDKSPKLGTRYDNILGKAKAAPLPPGSSLRPDPPLSPTQQAARDGLDAIDRADRAGADRVGGSLNIVQESPKPARSILSRDFLTRVLPGSAERLLLGTLNAPFQLPAALARPDAAMERTRAARLLDKAGAPDDAKQQRDAGRRDAVGSALGVLPFGDVAESTIFDGPAAGFETIKKRALTDPVSIAADGIMARGLVRGLGRGGPKAPGPEPIPGPMFDAAGNPIVRGSSASSRAALTKRLLGGAREVIELPRALMASADLSAPRQAIALTSTRPRQALVAGRDMFVAALSEKKANGQTVAISRRPNAQTGLYQRSGLAIDAVGSELFRSNLAERIPVVGKVVRASDRAYTSYLSRLRADVFDSTLAGWKKKGITEATHPQEIKALADWINTASGAGDLGRLKVIEPALRAAMWSPQQTAAKVRMLNPATYAKMPPATRKIAMRDMAATVAEANALLSLAAMGGADVQTDPKRSDWGTIRIPTPDGKQATRLDLFGQLRPWARVLVLASTGEGSDAGAAAGKVARGQLGPMPSAVYDLLTGSDMAGQPATIDSVAAKRVTPMFLADLREAVRAHGPRGLLIAAPGAIGAGANTYPRSKADRAAALLQRGTQGEESERQERMRRLLAPRSSVPAR